VHDDVDTGAPERARDPPPGPDGHVTLVREPSGEDDDPEVA
jgi:hypothetical protein